MLIVEDGTMPLNANCYISLEEADNYLIMRGLWEVTTDEEMQAMKEQAIIRACDYMNTLSWKGEKHDIEQVLALPRKDFVVSENVIPKACINANAELASIFFNGTDLFSPTRQGVLSKTETVDVITESVTYSANAPSVDYYKSVMGLLEPFLRHTEGEKQGIKTCKVVLDG